MPNQKTLDLLLGLPWIFFLLVSNNSCLNKPLKPVVYWVTPPPQWGPIVHLDYLHSQINWFTSNDQSQSINHYRKWEKSNIVHATWADNNETMQQVVHVLHSCTQAFCTHAHSQSNLLCTLSITHACKKQTLKTESMFSGDIYFTYDQTCFQNNQNFLIN